MFRARFIVFLGLLFAILGLVPATARAQAGTVGERIATCVRRDAAGLDAARLFAAPAGFDCRTAQRAFGPGDYWVISGPLSIDADTMPLAVRVASVWQRKMTLHARFADGTTLAFPIDGREASRSLQLGAIVQRMLPRQRAPLVRLLWHVEDSENLRGIILAPTVAPAVVASRSNIMMAAIYAGFAGVCVALLIYNLGLARALKHQFLPFYCLMMIGMLLYGFTSSGALAWALPGIENTARLKLNYLLLALTGIAGVGFLRHFFEQRVIAPWLGQMITLASVAVALPAVIIALVGPWQLRAFDFAFALGFAVMLSTVIPILVNAWVQRSEYLWLFVVAWTAPIVLAATRTAHGLNLIQYHFWLDNSTIISMAFEALLSSLAIAYRILLITRERDAARAQEITQRMLADADPLTGLMNRRAFLREAIGRPGDQQLLLIDIDNFKRVNDTIGHDGGDEVLRVVARILRTSAPQALVARIGGEEFAIVSSAADAIDAQHMLSALRAGRMPFDLTVTASIGLCAGPLTRESDWKAMYCAADRALFEAKAAGRDRVRDAAALPLPVAA